MIPFRIPKALTASLAVIVLLVLALLYKWHKLGSDVTLPQTVEVVIRQGKCALHASTAPVAASLRQKELHYVADTVACRHPLPFLKTPETEFRAKVQSFDSKVDAMTPGEYLITLMRVTALAGEPHTTIDLDDGAAHYFPLELRWFPEGYRVVAAHGCDECVGARLVSINGRPWQQVYDAATTLIGFENEFRAHDRADRVMLWAEGLEALHLGESGHAVFGLEKDGKEFSQTLSPTELLPMTEQRLALLRPNWRYMADSNTVYLFFKQIVRDKEFHGQEPEIEQSLRQHPDARFVVDLRDDTGGDNFDFLHFMDHLGESLGPRKTFILVGPHVFSSGIDRTQSVQRNLKGVTVGEATGGRPRYCGDTETRRLPYTQAWLSYSLVCDDGADTGPKTMQPDVQVATSWQQVKSGQDPVLEMALTLVSR